MSSNTPIMDAILQLKVKLREQNYNDDIEVRLGKDSFNRLLGEIGMIHHMLHTPTTTVSGSSVRLNLGAVVVTCINYKKVIEK